jgi:chromosome segregation ATPase
MAIKTEQLAEETYNKLRNLQDEINNLVVTIGQAHLQIRDSETQLKNFKFSLENLETQFDEKNEELNEVLYVMEKAYPKGEIDLINGTITYEEAE